METAQEHFFREKGTCKVIHNFLCKHKKSTSNSGVIHNFDVDKVDNYIPKRFSPTL